MKPLIYTPHHSTADINLFISNWSKDYSEFWAQLWSYKLTHKIVEIRIQHSSDFENNFHIISHLTRRFEGNLYWRNLRLEVLDILPGAGEYVIQDTAAGFSMVCKSISIFTNVPLSYNKTN